MVKKINSLLDKFDKLESQEKLKVAFSANHCTHVKGLVGSGLSFRIAAAFKNLNQSILEKAENLKYIGRLGVGLDNIDTEYCKKNNIFVQPATGMNADSVAEYVISSSLSLLKKTKLINEKTQSGQWPRTSITTNELRGKILQLKILSNFFKMLEQYHLYQTNEHHLV